MTDLNSLITKYRSKGILVDTNILLLYFVGTTNRERIQRFSRTKTFLLEDYDLLSRFEKIANTTNILTEVNSLVGKLTEPERSQWFNIFAQGISLMEECYIEIKIVAMNERF